jgi:hypothetical protein
MLFIVGVWSLFLEKSEAGQGHPNDQAAIRGLRLNKTAIVGIFPDRKPWARCPPGVHRFLIRAFLPSDPLQQVQNQILNGVGHG